MKIKEISKRNALDFISSPSTVIYMVNTIAQFIYRQSSLDRLSVRVKPSKGTRRI